MKGLSELFLQRAGRAQSEALRAGKSMREFWQGSAKALRDAAETVEKYAERCAPKTTPPTVEAFRKHEAVHGPWLRVKILGLWRQIGLGNESDTGLSRTFSELRHGGRVEAYGWSDADGNAVPGPE